MGMRSKSPSSSSEEEDVEEGEEDDEVDVYFEATAIYRRAASTTKSRLCSSKYADVSNCVDIISES